MTVWEIIAIGIALSMDACAITIANCTVYKKSLSQKKLWSMPTAFAVFQGIMPLIGFFIGSLFAKYLQSFGGYITAAVFYILSFKIVFDLIKEMNCQGDQCKNGQVLTYTMVLIQAVATSVDAFVIGVSLSFSLTFSIFIAVLIIALTTFVLVAIAMLLGKYLGSILGKYAEWVGAVILFILATKELVMAIIG